MAAQRAAQERLKSLREEIARDTADLRGRWRTARDRLPREWQELRTVSRDLLEMVWLLLRRRSSADSTTPPVPPSPR